MPGWKEGLQMMSVGSRYKLYPPTALGRGAAGKGPIPPNLTLIFDVEPPEIAGSRTSRSVDVPTDPADDYLFPLFVVVEVDPDTAIGAGPVGHLQVVVKWSTLTDSVVPSPFLYLFFVAP